MHSPNLNTFQRELKDELFENILPYWPRLRTTDSFIPALDSANQPLPDTRLGLIMVSRLLWTYSRAFTLYGKQEYLELAEHAKHVLCMKFADTENGGYCWSLGSDGHAFETKKQCYGQAFCLYAFSEHYAATQDQDSLNRAYSLFRLIEDKAWDPQSGGYLESFEADWTPLEKMRLGEDDLDAPKTMNNHLHVIEAFANLQKIAASPEVEAACRRVLRIIADRIILSDTPRFGLFYDMDWNLRDDVVSPGHDIEGSWLLHEAAEIIGDPDLESEFKKLAVDMAEQVYQTGLDPTNGAVNYEFHPGKDPDTSKHWWPQAEGLVGFFNAYQLSGDTRYLDASYKIWDYIKIALIDQTNGEWLWGRHADGTAMGMEKAGPWKSSYHNARACFEMIDRTKRV
ncbi:AGE family epimerase/isomerase [Pelagicoccus sp. SDUM812002]|uniref:AGE family epimerase/isomerase n=1 Tax=Pelagicoccus sp. SDUM812002 TaxID=3041266 RepID=UPI00280E7271|nr:AGE family epimerase/isomerase [Pelagicoccus sp. SDUM812002]MDQ8186048.1 AGE family epimerase/isomerase [Pelagicoccus sp. SDUM812002]